jgi:hypothetical protein
LFHALRLLAREIGKNSPQVAPTRAQKILLAPDFGDFIRLLYKELGQYSSNGREGRRKERAFPRSGSEEFFDRPCDWLYFPSPILEVSYRGNLINYVQMHGLSNR